jgi:biotin-dependent carboxylase-like uncharacterized protein
LIHIVEAGLRSTVQDAGRFAHLRSGIPPAGPADATAFRAANALVGNPLGSACIEIVGSPFSLRCDDARMIAVAGRDVSVTVRGPVPAWSSLFVRAGQTLTVRAGTGTRYAYVAVGGGIATDPVLGSRAAYPVAGIGAVLRSGDALPLGESAARAESAARSIAAPPYDGRVRAMAGPHADRFASDAIARFFGEEFGIDAASDRQGVRLLGPSVAPQGGEVLTCGMVAGAVEVPRGGEPIVLLADHQTTGGYPVIATVIDADLGKVAQLAPGEAIRFYRVERAEALEALRAERRVLEGALARA